MLGSGSQPREAHQGVSYGMLDRCCPAWAQRIVYDTPKERQGWSQGRVLFALLLGLRNPGA